LLTRKAPRIAAVVVLATAWQAHAAVDFDKAVAPILARRCLDCHSGPEPKGKLDLSRRASAAKGGDEGPAVVPGKPDESPLWAHVEADEMPPKSPLPPAEKSVLKDWILSGAAWGTDPIDVFHATTDRRAGRDWWAFQPVRRPVPPVPQDPSKAANPIDAFVLEALDAKGLTPAPPADRRTLIRRLTFDLTGLPPTPGEVAAFENDLAPDAYERLVDRLLASPGYGARWARLWLDVARFGESNGFEFDEFRPNAWRYRDWVVSALNRNTPYDEFARLQLAGDVLRPADPSAAEATGFLVAGAYDTVGQDQQSAAMRKVVRQDEMEDLVGAVGQTFLGLTVHCARCHDHKFDPIRQEEYYRLSAALAGVRRGDRDLSPIDPAYQDVSRRLERLAARLESIEAPARAKLAGERRPSPAPVALWPFDRGTAGDAAGTLHATPAGGARLDRDGLRLDGVTGHARTVPLSTDLTARTLMAWVRLDNLKQRGGGVVSLQSADGAAFDALVFGEREPGRWMAGSENFARYQSFRGPEETEADRRAVCVAVVYAADGTVSAYRDGKPYGRPYNAGPPVTFPAGGARVVFGMRNGTTPGDNRMLAGNLLRAAVFDRALGPDEVTAAAAGVPTTDEVVALLSPADRDERSRLGAEVEAGRKALAGKTRRAFAVVPRKPEPTHLLVRGNTATPGELVAPGGVAALAGPPADFGLPPDAPDAARRTRLAAWVADPANPLAARVAVNRVWQAHFGAGLVETPSDFGFNGGRPSHPALLDWLASEFVSRGWDLKALHRLVVTSSAYRRSPRPDPAAARVDADNRLLWRVPPRRLEAEMVRDAMLAAAGVLNPAAGGPGFREFVPERAPGTAAIIYKAVDPDGPGSDRRTLYRTWARGGRNGFLDAFDCPDPSTAIPRRASTTTPLQALALLNNALTLRLSDRFADRLRREAGDDPGLQADLAYRLAFARPPDDAERADARRVVEDHGAAALARAIFNSNEFLYVD